MNFAVIDKNNRLINYIVNSENPSEARVAMDLNEIKGNIIPVSFKGYMPAIFRNCILDNNAFKLSLRSRIKLLLRKIKI